MKFRNGSELFQMHSGYFKIIQLWFGKRVFDIGYYPQHTFHFWCHSNGAVNYPHPKGCELVMHQSSH